MTPDQGKEEENQLMTIAQIAEFSGLSRQRVHALSNSDPAWPRPVAEARRTRVYAKPDVESYFANRVKRQGKRTDLEARSRKETDNG